MVVQTLLAIRKEDAFDIFWLKVLRSAQSFDLEPQLPRNRRRPKRYEEGKADGEFHNDLSIRLASDSFIMKLLIS